MREIIYKCDQCKEIINAGKPLIIHDSSCKIIKLKDHWFGDNKNAVLLCSEDCTRKYFKEIWENEDR